MLTRCSVSGIGIEIGSEPGRRDRLHAARPRAAADAIDEIARPCGIRSARRRARQQRVVHRQHADRRGVTAVRAVRLDQLLRIHVTVVEIEA